jgi:3'(2'), 5'-bisphosphate nucleotidase
MIVDVERRVAVESVIKACNLCRTVQSAHVAGGVIGKEDGSPVTVADFGAQAVVSAHLMAAFPNLPLVGEEDSKLLRRKDNATLKQAVMKYAQGISPHLSDSQVLEAIDRGAADGGPQGRFWTLDPIDGTKGFLRGDQYAVALALIENGRVVLGVLGCPNLPLNPAQPEGPRGALFVGARGQGAGLMSLDERAERKIRVTDIEDPAQAVFCESFESDHSSHDDSLRVAKLLGTKHPPVRMDSQAKYGVLAKGDAAIYLRIPTEKSYTELIWDHAAGAMIVEEAGGVVTDIHGKPLDFSAGKRLSRNHGVIASNGKFHGRIVEAVNSVIGTHRTRD